MEERRERGAKRSAKGRGEEEVSEKTSDPLTIEIDRLSRRWTGRSRFSEKLVGTDQLDITHIYREKETEPGEIRSSWRKRRVGAVAERRKGNGSSGRKGM